MAKNVTALLLGLLAIASMVRMACGGGGHDYGMALRKSILYFEAQRSGVLPPNQRVPWRASSGLFDGKANGVDLVGGYYDAGDNVKFGLPMAFTVTMMSWSILEYGKQMAAAGELRNAMDAIKWGTDYFIKAHPEPDVLYGEVGDGDTDHSCWQRPEDMTTSRQAFRVDPQNPGSDLAGETAAAMAAASLVFRNSYPGYANLLLEHSKQLFEFADKYRGKYDVSITVARNYYGSFSGYGDELLWAAAWLYEATEDKYYLDYLANNGDALGGTGWSINQFGWDVKYPGVQVLAAKFLLQGRAGEHAATLQRYQQNAEFFVCSCIGKGTANVPRTPGGMMYHQRWNNLQFVTSASFLLTVYADYATVSGKGAVRCPAGAARPFEILAFVRSQVNYILGDNPRGTSYMVGYGGNFPRQVHHRGASIVSVRTDPSFVSCQEGYSSWYPRQAGNPNVLEGAVVGGPDEYDDFADERNNYEQTEAATYNSAPLLGVLARLAGACGGLEEYQSLPEVAAPPSSHAGNHTSLPPSHHRHASSPIEIEQSVTRTWAMRRQKYYRYSVTVTNRSRKTVRGLHIGVSDLSGRLWGLDKARYGYVPPRWLPALRAGRSLMFVYVQPAPPANVWITGYKLV
ncbi:endoglucanase 15-like [Phragmites australis]|uniref:endoglucanase 15-like n=1 Tax=Phragmites australis TaxID=29695 RepID=UPI002D77F70E|nr:endoglucanase 15-like [Phragmites australis]